MLYTVMSGVHKNIFTWSLDRVYMHNNGIRCGHVLYELGYIVSSAVYISTGSHR